MLGYSFVECLVSSMYSSLRSSWHRTAKTSIGSNAEVNRSNAVVVGCIVKVFGSNVQAVGSNAADLTMLFD